MARRGEAYMHGLDTKAARARIEGRTLTQEAADANGLNNPVTQASIELGWRFVRKPNGDVHLDGRLSSMQDVIRVANEIRARRGDAPIRYPGVTV